MSTKKKPVERTSEELFAEVDALRSRAKELKKEAKKKKELEEKQRREQEYRERVKAALAFYEHKDLFEKAYQVYKETQVMPIKNGESTVYAWVMGVLGKHEPYDWRNEVPDNKIEDTQG